MEHASSTQSTDGRSSVIAEIWDIPRLAKGQRLDLKAIRAPNERFYLGFVLTPTVLLALVVVAMLFNEPLIVVGGACIALLLTLLIWIGWQLFLAILHGHAIKVGPTQYSQLHSLVADASEVLGIETPTIFVLQGHGLFEAFVARKFSRRGILIITSNLLDDLTEHGSSRELMFFIGRQLGLIATGYFRYWTIKHTIGQFSMFFYWAWQRRTHLTADRLGLLVAGELYAAEQALLIITAGSGIAANTNFQAIKEQRSELFDRFWAWIQLGFSSYPYMVDRIVQLREFANSAANSHIPGNSPIAIGALPILHRPIRAVPLMIVHGHDISARMQLENFLLKQFPHITPVTMIDKADAAQTLPEKFERMAGGVRGALAILTPDDLVVTLRTGSDSPRARQNVIVEVGWFWGKFGRGKCLLLVRGDVEIPSDLSGVEVHRFAVSPTECSEALREFIAALELK